jgi:hypothetical protein
LLDFYGPKGIGALYVRRKPRVRLEAQMHGGGHERGMRSGTLPTHQMRRASARPSASREAEMGTESERIRMLRDRLLGAACRSAARSTSNGDLEQRVPHNLNVSFDYVEGESLIMGDQGHRGVVGLGLHLGQPGAELRAARPRPQRRAGAQLEPAHLHRPLHHRGGGRLRGRHAAGQGRQAARDVARCGRCARTAST